MSCVGAWDYRARFFNRDLSTTHPPTHPPPHSPSFPLKTQKRLDVLDRFEKRIRSRISNKQIVFPAAPPLHKLMQVIDWLMGWLIS
jgi:hypothetical protein